MTEINEGLVQSCYERTSVPWQLPQVPCIYSGIWDESRFSAIMPGLASPFVSYCVRNWVLGLADFKNEAADPRGECYSS